MSNPFWRLRHGKLVSKSFFIVLQCLILLLCLPFSCTKKSHELKVVSFSDFELFVKESGYITNAEKYGWSIVQKDVHYFEKVEGANWRLPDGENVVSNGNLPVTQVSFNDAMAYCKWAKKRLPIYSEYWEMVKKDSRVIVSENRLPISEVDEVNIVGNVWEITASDNNKVRLAGGSLFCSESTCHGTVPERELYVDKETGNIHIGFAVMDL